MPDRKQLGIRGATRCPVCGSRSISKGLLPEGHRLRKSHAFTTLARCYNPACGALWEWFDAADLLDPGVEHSSFKEPCDNCAFRPGSPEQKDPARWRELMDSLKGENREIGNMHYAQAGRFYCHKGVPIRAGAEHGFAYPMKNGQVDPSKLRLCRGYLKMFAAMMDKEMADG